MLTLTLAARPSTPPEVQGLNSHKLPGCLAAAPDPGDRPQRCISRDAFAWWSSGCQRRCRVSYQEREKQGPSHSLVNVLSRPTIKPSQRDRGNRKSAHLRTWAADRSAMSRVKILVGNYRSLAINASSTDPGFVDLSISGLKSRRVARL